MNRRDFIGAAIGAPCSGYEPACDKPRQFERALMLADLVEASLISRSLAGRLADELRLEHLCWVPT